MVALLNLFIYLNWSFDMPVVAAVVEFIVADAAAETVTTAVANSILGGTVLAAPVTGAVLGGLGGAVGAAVTGGDIGKGIESGFIGGGIGAGVGKEIGGLAQEAGASPELAKAIGKGVGTTAGGVATGQELGAAATRGLISGGVQYGFGDAPKDASKADQAILAAEKQLATQAAGSLFAPKTTFTTSEQAGGASQPTSVATTGAGTSPGSQALAQALRLDPGAPVFGGEKDKEGKKSGWNVASLRYMGNSEA